MIYEMYKLSKAFIRINTFYPNILKQCSHSKTHSTEIISKIRKVIKYELIKLFYC